MLQGSAKSGASDIFEHKTEKVWMVVIIMNLVSQKNEWHRVTIL